LHPHDSPPCRLDAVTDNLTTDLSRTTTAS
jgi:hypothetical protein